MKLTTEQLIKLKAFANLAGACKVDKIIIDDETMRGIDEDKSVFIRSADSIFDEEITACITRLGALRSRISTFESLADFAIEFSTNSQKTDEVDTIKLQAKGTKADFRTGSPSAVRIPKAVNDEARWAFTISSSTIKTLIQTSGSIGSGCSKVILTSKPSGEIYFEFNDDDTSDNISVLIAEGAQWIPEDMDQPKQAFVHYYLLKTLTPLLKFATNDVVMIVGEKGMLQLIIDEITVTVIPRIGN